MNNLYEIPSHENSAPLWFVIFLLLVFPPIGLILLIMQKRYHSFIPWLFWIFASFFLLLSLAFKFLVEPQLVSLYKEFNFAENYSELTINLSIVFSLLQIITGFLIFRKIKLANDLSKKLLIICSFFFLFDLFLPVFLVINIVKPIYVLTSSLQDSTYQKPKFELLTPTPKPNVWKTYINKNYGFELDYPIEGVIQDTETDFHEGECGKAIKENGNEILVDNFFIIKIIDWQGTMDDYLIQRGAKQTYEVEPIEKSNADEAIKVIGIKKGMELVSVGFPPLMYVSHIYKKDGKIFTVSHQAHPPNPLNKEGCINPKDVDQTKYPAHAEFIWNLEESFKFLKPSTNP